MRRRSRRELWRAVEELEEDAATVSLLDLYGLTDEAADDR